MIYFVILVLCVIVFLITPIVINNINPYGLSEKIYSAIVNILFVLIIIFGGLTIMSGYLAQREEVKVYYNLSDEEIKNYSQKTIDKLYEKIPELEAEKTIQRSKERL